MPRDDFPEPVKRTVAARVAYFCSRPDCRAQTSGPHSDNARSLNIGVAAHITAAAVGGPRYDSTLSAELRSDIANAIWLCQTCAKLVDNDVGTFPESLLRKWKEDAEELAFAMIGRPKVMVREFDLAILAKSKPTGTTEKLFVQELADSLLIEVQQYINANDPEKAIEAARRLEQQIRKSDGILSQVDLKNHYYALARIYTAEVLKSKRTGTTDPESIQKAREYLTKAKSQSYE